MRGAASGMFASHGLAASHSSDRRKHK
ncbi:hypothetical protein CBM2585_A130520 [Cupriavidus taiwanensis]|nr:hypothetical protein CBM2585_A130520 [Cupriavidus taiwanensis]